MTDIRNIIQSHQEREVIKTAPDLVVYLDGLPYVFNPWLPRNMGAPVLVNFNDFVTSVSTTHGVETLIPHGSIHLSVPNHDKNLFQAPGGNRVFNTMDEIQIYAKGYYFSKTGNSVYRRIFHGLIQSINYQDTGSTLEIDISCLGILHLLELMQINLAPSAMSHGDVELTAFQTRFAKMNAHQTIAAMFETMLDLSVFLRSSVDEQNIKNTGHNEALKMGFINKWQIKLIHLKKLVRLFGLDRSKNETKEFEVEVEVDQSGDPKKKGVKVKKRGSYDLTGINKEKILEHLPSMGIGQIALLDSKITSRLEHLKTMVNCILYEAYQDLDGSIIIKPPLYNLDVTRLSKSKDKPSEYTDQTNPFIIWASEVESESENEDETQIRATRMSLQGSWSPTIQLGGGNDILGVISYVDSKLVSRFGVREEPPKTISFMGNNSEGLYALAASELAKSNRGFRSYSCTIPMRPELKVGFPLYISHHDMYVYPRTITTSYNVGGKATTNIQADTIRKRPMHPVEVDVTAPDGKTTKQTVYKSIPNLCLAWSIPDKDSKEASRSNPVGADFSLGKVEKTPAGYARLIDYYRNKLGTNFGVTVKDDSDDPSKVKRWRVQNDSPYNPDYEKTSLTRVKVGDSWRLHVDKKYLDLTRTYQPYTDERGYEVLSPFPWGRWMTLDDALKDFTRDGFLDEAKDPTFTRTVTGASDFVYAGLGSVNLNAPDIGEGEKKKTVFDLLQAVKTDVSSPFTTAFELGPASPSPESFMATTNQQGAKQTADSKAATNVSPEGTKSGEAPEKHMHFVGRGELGLGPNDTRTNPLVSSDKDTWGTKWANAMTSSVSNAINGFGSSLNVQPWDPRSMFSDKK